MNRYVIIGWIGGNSELIECNNFKQGKQIAEELKKSPVWKPVWEGSLIDLITKLEKEA